jgi:hypothetical protein
MPARRLRLRCSHVFTLIAVVFLVPAGVRAQTVTLRGSVSKTVALSVPPNSDLDASVVSSGNSVRVTLSSTDAASPAIRIPLLVRSNSGFKILATFESTTAELSQISVSDVRPTGDLVSQNVSNALEVMPHSNPDISQPLLVLSGPRVSLGGTLDSPSNALQITLLIRLKPTQPVRDWLAHLTFVASPE